MKRICLIFVCLLFLVSCQSSQNKDNRTNSNYGLESNEKEILTKLNQFSFQASEKYFNEVKEDNDAFSPLSFYFNLAMINLMAKNIVSKEIADVLSMSQNDIEIIAEKFKNNKLFYGDEIKESNEGKLEAIEEGFFGLDNSFWINENQSINNKILPKLINTFNANVYKIDFSNQKFLEDYTRNFMKNDKIIFPKFDVSSIFTIMNLLSLKDVWSFGDLKESTEDYQFNTISSKMLLGNYEDGKIYEEDDFKSFYINTKNGYRLTFILPKNNTSLQDVMSKKTIEKVININYTMSNEKTSYKTRCIFPKFTISNSKSLKKLCQNLGIKEMFLPSTDFLIFNENSIFVHDVIQNIYIEVNKNGIDAGAITYTSFFGNNSQQTEYFDFVVDRSFGFVITDVKANNLLFSGIVQNII